MSLITSSSCRAFSQGAINVLPVSIACIPWGLLAGSLAVGAHLTPLQSQGLSAIVFAGAAQLVAIGMIKSGAGVLSIFITTVLLTSQHLLYGMHMRPAIARLPLRWRLGLGFLLTDEFFALNSQQDLTQFNRWYALGIGLPFYLAWNLSTLAGILLGKNIPHLESFGLEFSIAAIFVALVAPLVKSIPTLVCVVVSLFTSIVLSDWHWQSALVLAGVSGMVAGFITQRLLKEFR